jgi:hypothetical protein
MMFRTLSHHAWLSAAVLLLCSSSPPVANADTPTYTAQFLTPGLSAVSAAAMNETADVVGTGTTGSGGWVSHAGAPAVLLPLPPGVQYAFANDINDAGVIVGSVGPSSSVGFGKAAAWIPDGSGGYTIQQFGTLPGHVYSDATAVNNVGDVIGYSSNGTFRYPVLFTAPGGIQDLSATGVFDPADINDQRVLIDHSFTCKRLDLNTMLVEDLGVPAGPPTYLASRGAAINELGQVAGAGILACCPNCDRLAARYTDGVGWEISSGCGLSNGAGFINDFGDVVMRLNVAPYVRFEGIGMFLIEDLIVADVGHWYVINGAGPINNARQMAIPATNSVTNQSGMILLTPVGFLVGDVNCDGSVNFGDINPFVLILADPTAWQTAYPTCPATNGDINRDGGVNFGDINPFVALLAAG